MNPSAFARLRPGRIGAGSRRSPAAAFVVRPALREVSAGSSPWTGSGLVPLSMLLRTLSRVPWQLLLLGWFQVRQQDFLLVRHSSGRRAAGAMRDAVRLLHRDPTGADGEEHGVFIQIPPLHHYRPAHVANFPSAPWMLQQAVRASHLSHPVV